MIKKTLIDYMPFFKEGTDTVFSAAWARRGIWKAKWITNTSSQEPQLSACRNRFELSEDKKVRIHVSADAWYTLFLDGVELGRGPELSAPSSYSFDTYDLSLSAGPHVLCALVWCFGPFAPFAKISLENGFLLGAEGELSAILDTNRNNWQGKVLPGVTVSKCTIGTVFPQIEIDHALFPADAEQGGGDGWEAPSELLNGRKSLPGIEYRNQHLLSPAMLPSMEDAPIRNAEVVYVSVEAGNFYGKKACLMEELALWREKLSASSFSVPPRTTRKILLRLDNYYCGYPVLRTSGGRGAVVSFRWAEALHLEDNPNSRKKGERDLFLDRYLYGNVDTMRCGGKKDESFPACGYRSGRFVELLIQTADEPLEVLEFTLRESRYPLEMEADFRTSDERLNACVAPAFRTLQMCMHDTYMDCPYYEQLMYLGDARLQMLLNYVVSSDFRMAEKSLRLIASGRADDGLLLCRYPASVHLAIPPFSMLFAGMVNDYVRYVADPGTLREILPRLHEVMDSLERYVRPDGLIVFPDSWNFVDWPDAWKGRDACRIGTPPEDAEGVSGVVNWTYAYALGQAAELHDWIGEPELAARYRRLGQSLTEKLVRTFYRPEEKLLSDLPAESVFSEHSQCLALLSGFLPPDLERTVSEALFARKVGMTEATVYFAFYYMEVCRKYNRMDAFMDRMKFWFDMLDCRMKTLLESPEPSRSDCHAWSAHPLYHFLASVLGVRPASAGFRSVSVEPMIGALTKGEGTLPHPSGPVGISFRRTSPDIADWKIVLPKDLSGRFLVAGKETALHSGENILRAVRIPPV